LKYAVKYDIK